MSDWLTDQRALGDAEIMLQKYLERIGTIGLCFRLMAEFALRQL